MTAPATGRTAVRRAPRTRRALALLAPLLLLLGALAGCTGGGGPGPEDTAHDEPGDIVVASGRDVTGKNGIRQRLIDAWNREHQDDGFRARLVELPGSADAQRSQLLGALQSGSADYDVVNLDVTWVPEFAAARLIRALPEDMIEKDVVPAVADTARWDGEVYAVPFNSDVGLLYYRPDYLRAAHVRRSDLTRVHLSWEQVQNLIRDVGKKPSRGYEKGWTTQLAAYEGRTVNALEAFASATEGFTLTGKDGRYRGNVTELMAGISELGKRTDELYTLGDAVRSHEDTSLDDFAEGRTAFLRHWPSAYRTLHETLSGSQVGVTRLPGHAVLGGQNLAVTASSPRARMARELVAFLTGKESERCLLDAGFAATRESAYKDDHVVCRLADDLGAAPTPSPTGEGTDHMPRDRHGRPAYAEHTLLPALESAVQRPRTPLYGAFTQTFTTALGPLFGDSPPGDAVLARRLDAALREALGD
jgi:multiple sugar transport system substrate-binding protein